MLSFFASYLALSSVGTWGFRYSELCLAPVAKLVVVAKRLTYQEVLDLDQKIRKAEPPPTVNFSDGKSLALSMCWYPRSHYKELSEYF